MRWAHPPGMLVHLAILVLVALTPPGLALPHASQGAPCTLTVTPSPVLSGVDTPVLVGEPAYIYLKGISPGQGDDVSFTLVSPEGVTTWARGSPYGSMFRGVSAPLMEPGVWNVTGSWSRGAETCLTSKDLGVLSAGFNTSALTFDQDTRRLGASAEPPFGPGPGSVRSSILLLDPSARQNNSGLDLRLDSVFATLTMDYESYLVAGRGYTIRADIRNNYLVDVNVTLELSLLTEVRVTVSLEPPTYAVYRPRVMETRGTVSVPPVGITSLWLNFTLPPEHDIPSGGWFPLRPGEVTARYELATSMISATESVSRRTYILPEGSNGMVVSAARVTGTSGATVSVGTHVPDWAEEGLMVMLVTTDQAGSYSYKHDVYFTPPVVGVNITSRNSTQVDIAATATSRNGVGPVEFLTSLDGTNWTRVCVDLTGSDGWTCSWNITGLEPGMYTVRAEATDLLGIRGEAEMLVRVSGPLSSSPPAGRPFPLVWLALALLAGAALIGAHRLMRRGDTLILSEREMRKAIVRGDVEAFNGRLIRSLGILTARYAGVPLKDSWDISTYASHLHERGVLTGEAERLLRAYLDAAYGRGPLGLRDIQKMYPLYLRYRQHLKGGRGPWS